MNALALLSEDDVSDPQTTTPAQSISEIEPPPTWTSSLARQLASFLDLEANWDSYGSVAPRPEAVVATLELLMLVADARTPAPQAVPTSSGGVQVEWHQHGIDLEVEIHSAFRFDAYYENSRTGEYREEELLVDLTPLRNWIAHLSE